MALGTSVGWGRPDRGCGVGGASAESRPDPRAGGRLPADFYARPVLEVARDLIGCVVEHRGVSGVIVETEAYHENEPACHAFVGVTERTRTLFQAPGLAYVYRSYGIHALLNAVCEPVGVGAAVLIRALEPLDGIEEMRVRRGRMREEDLCSGPGKLTQALGVELSENGSSLVDGPISIRAGSGAGELEGIVGRREGIGAPEPGEPAVIVSTRIGISKAVELRWRFCAADNPHVSRPWPKGVGMSRRRARNARREEAVAGR
jgi:DNA-3-methyladenine glycosylase